MAPPQNAILVRFERTVFGLDRLLPLLRALSEADPTGRPELALWVSREGGMVVLTVVPDADGAASEVLSEALKREAEPGAVRPPPTLAPDRYLAGFEAVVPRLEDPWRAVHDVLVYLKGHGSEDLLDRRAAVRRRPTGLAAEVRFGDLLTPGLVHDISLSGCFVQASPPLPAPGTSCEVLLLGPEPVTLDAVVVQQVTEAGERRPVGIALQFQPSQAQGDSLQALLLRVALKDPSARRGVSRVQTPVEVTLRSAEEVHRALTADLSGGGLFVPMASPPPVGEAVDVMLRLPGEELPVELPAVVRHREAGGLRPGAGLAFHTAPEALAPLEAWLRTARQRQTKLVLVADDDPFFRSVTADLLGSAGYKVMLAEDGEAALRAVSEHILELSLVLLDVEMPGLTGDSLLDRIRRAGGEHDLPLVVCSGTVPDDAGREALRSLGADAFLDKQDLDARLLDVVDRHALAPRQASAD